MARLGVSQLNSAGYLADEERYENRTKSRRRIHFRLGTQVRKITSQRQDASEWFTPGRLPRFYSKCTPRHNVRLSVVYRIERFWQVNDGESTSVIGERTQ
jgi:hypothetical protein